MKKVNRTPDSNFLHIPKVLGDCASVYVFDPKNHSRIIHP